MMRNLRLFGILLVIEKLRSIISYIVQIADMDIQKYPARERIFILFELFTV